MYFVFWKQGINPKPKAPPFDSDEAKDDASNDGDDAKALDEPQPNPLDVTSEAGRRRGSREKRKTVKFSPGGQNAKTQVVTEPGRGRGRGASTAST
nr:hypothetical protein [Tanacetum cinerariifolium]